MAIQMLRESLTIGDPVDLAFNYVGMGLSVLSLMLDVGSVAVIPSPRLSATGIAIGGTALIVNSVSWAYSEVLGPTPPAEDTYIALGLSVTSTVASYALYSAGF